MTMHKKKKICLALQGGGAYGAFTWGILDQFLEADCFEIDAISATSSGSINAVVLAQAISKGGPEEARKSLRKLWQSISDLGERFSPVRENPIEELLGTDFTSQLSFHIFDAMTHLYSPYILNPANYNPLSELLESIIDFDDLNSNKINIFLCATNVKTGRLKIFTKPNLTADTLMASACLPNLYQAVAIDNEFYWDGGFLGNPAIYPLIYNSQVDDIIIVHTNPLVRDSIPRSSAEIENRLNEVSFNSSLIRELRAIAFVTKLLDEGYIKDQYKEEIRRKFIHIVRSDMVMNEFKLINKYKWSWRYLTQLYDLGRIVAKDWLSNNYKAIGEKSTLDFKDYL